LINQNDIGGKTMETKQLTDDDIRNMERISLKDAGRYLGISGNAVGLGMRNNLLPIGFAVQLQERDWPRTSESWTYNIIAERLIAYKYGKITEVQIQNVENSLNTMIEKFQELKDMLGLNGLGQELTGTIQRWPQEIQFLDGEGKAL
jgi:hypothetical protein